MFLVDRITGTVQTNQTYGRFGDGYFTLYVSATNQLPKRLAKALPDFKDGSFHGDIAKIRVRKRPSQRTVHYFLFQQKIKQSHEILSFTCYS